MRTRSTGSVADNHAGPAQPQPSFQDVGQSARTSTSHPQEVREASHSQRREQRTDEETSGTAGPRGEQSTPLQPGMGQDTPHLPTTDSDVSAGRATAQALAELQQWFREEQDRRELRRLEELRRRFEQGDVSALDEAVATSRPTQVTRSALERANLPRPEPPHRYEKKNRADYNRWLRDNEDYHAKNPVHFQEDKQKLSFGLQYVNESLRTLWEVHVAQERRDNPCWTPTWEDLKEKMLGALGTLEERRQAAFDSLKASRQKPTQSPTDFLNYLQPLWVEVGETNPARMMVEFTGALLEEVRKELRRLPQQSKATLSQVEQEANRIYRDLAQGNKIKKGSNKDRRRQRSSPEPAPTRQTPKKPKKGDDGPLRPRPPRDGKEKPKGDVVCYACKEPGHVVPKCPNEAKREAYFSKKAKDKGQKN